MDLHETLAKSVEDARLGLVQAQKSHDDAVGRVDVIRSRISAAQARQAEITQKRLSGETSEADAGEYAALTGDLDALNELLNEAETAAKSAEAPLDEARTRVAGVEAEWARHESETLLAGLREKAVSLENLLVDCLQEMAGRALAAGHGVMLEVWSPGDRLRDFVNRSDLVALSSGRR